MPDLITMVNVMLDLLIVGTIIFCAVGLFELLRPNPRIKP